MLPLKPWKTEAVIRLLAGVFVCIYSGALLTVLNATMQSGKFDFRMGAVTVVALAFLAATLYLLQRPWQLESLNRQLALLVLCFYAGLFLGAWAQKMAGPPGMAVAHMIISAVTFQGAALVLVSVFVRGHGVSWGDAFGLDQKTRESVLYGVTLACVFLPVGWGLQWASGELMQRLPPWGEPEQQQAVATLRMAAGWLDRVVLALVTIGIVPVAEEMLFRGILYPWIKQIGFPRLSLWGTSILFAAVHLNAVSFLPLLLFAIVLTLLYEYTGNLLAPISAHALFNALNFATLYLVELGVK